MNKIYSMLGIARKGGKLSIGFDATCLDIRNNKSKLVLIAKDASEKTNNNIQFECDKYDVKFIEFGEKELIGRCLGKKVVSVLSINDENIVDYILNNI
ncbi:MAG: ribosomal L7Ae/L30e/S12e/Gadd45 family protein [Tissierellia bacterium]|nr:ribosomal L7Ae/L30e/S12e/Gadd45 family protein [Tissierellia bacterium]